MRASHHFEWPVVAASDLVKLAKIAELGVTQYIFGCRT
jgi:hypothetical protein